MATARAPPPAAVAPVEASGPDSDVEWVDTDEEEAPAMHDSWK